MSDKKLLFKTHQGLGDHILCVGLYKTLAQNYSECLLPVRQPYRRAVANMLQEIENINVFSYDSKFTKTPWESWYFGLGAHERFLTKRGHDSLNLGSFDTNFLKDGITKFDHEFYKQAEVPFQSRWESGFIHRDSSKETELFDALAPHDEPYIFVHDDASRNFKINPKYFPPEVKIIRPSQKLMKRYSISDYLTLIENALEIHCIESSFCALIETYGTDVPKFAHRYARPEALGSTQLEFTYKSSCRWN